MGRYDDDDYDTRAPPRRSKTTKHRESDGSSDEPRPSRRHTAYAPDPPSAKDKRSIRDYGDLRDIEPKSSGSDRDRRNGKSRGAAYGDDGDDNFLKSSSRRDKERSRKTAYDEDESIAPLPKSRSYKGRDAGSDTLPPTKNEGRLRRANTLDVDDLPRRRDSKRESGYDERRDKRPSRYDNDLDDSVVAKPRRPRYDDKGYKSYDDTRAKGRSHRDDDDGSDRDRYRRADRRRDTFDDTRRSDRDRDRGYQSADEDKRRDSYRRSDRDRDRDRDRGKDRYGSYSDRDREKLGDRSRAAGGTKTKYGGLKLDPDSIRGYYETGQKHYKTFKPIIDSVAKMYLNSKKP